MTLGQATVMAPACQPPQTGRSAQELQALGVMQTAWTGRSEQDAEVKLDTSGGISRLARSTTAGQASFLQQGVEAGDGGLYSKQQQLEHTVLRPAEALASSLTGHVAAGAGVEQVAAKPIRPMARRLVPEASNLPAMSTAEPAARLAACAPALKSPSKQADVLPVHIYQISVHAGAAAAGDVPGSDSADARPNIA